MRNRFLDLWDRRNGVWNAGVYVVFASVDATLSHGVFRIVWVVVGLAALFDGTVTLIKQRRVARRSRELAPEPATDRTSA